MLAPTTKQRTILIVVAYVLGALMVASSAYLAWFAMVWGFSPYLAAGPFLLLMVVSVYLILMAHYAGRGEVKPPPISK